MKQSEDWGVLVRDDSKLINLSHVSANDLRGKNIIVSQSRPMQNELNNWFGTALEDIKIVSKYNLLYNSAILAKKNLGVVLCLDLESNYDGLKFIPLKPELKYNSVLAWKADQISSKTVSSFIEFAKKYIKEISVD